MLNTLQLEQLKVALIQERMMCHYSLLISVHHRQLSQAYFSPAMGKSDGDKRHGFWQRIEGNAATKRKVSIRQGR